MATREPAGDDDPDLEHLLAEALARFDEGGQPALDAFVAGHPHAAPGLERGIRRCRELGLLGSRAPAQAPERLGVHRLVRRIGGGGMGVVYEAVQEPLGRRVALKMIRPELLYFEGARERFRREVDAVARLQHPALVSVFSAGEQDGVPFFTMEMIDGVTIDQACARFAGRDPAALRGADLRALAGADDETGELFAGAWWETAVRVVQQAALGLRHAHLRGIVHRDVKPSNLIVTPHGQAIVLDFGVAQVRLAKELTRSGAVPGSPAFMSPEQRRGLATDERTDVFSLAATAWQMLALERPFRDEDLMRVDGGVPPLRDLRKSNGAVPSELDLVLRTAMDPDRDRRYGDMGRFAADLQAVLDRRPIAARPAGLALRAVRFCQRHRTLATASALTAVLTAGMLVALLVVQGRARAALQATNEDLTAAKAQLESAASQLAAEQERTRASLDTSLEAMHSVLVALGNDRLRAVPQAERVAHGVLVDAAALFRDLLRRHPGDERVRWRSGHALHALAMSFERRGQGAEAMRVLREALAVLGDDAKATPALRNVRGHALKTLASWLVMGPDRAGALDAIARAEADFAVDAAGDAMGDKARQADSLRARADLAATRSHASDERTDPAEVERWLREAVGRQRACMALGVPDEKDPVLLVMHLTNLGKFLQRADRGKEALPVLDEALALSRSLPAHAWPPPAVQTAEVQETIGNTMVNLGDPRAEQLLTDCVATRRRAVDQFPDNLEFRVRLAGTVHNLGRHQRTSGRIDAALATFEAARTIQRAALAQAPDHPIALDFMGKHLEMIGYCHTVRRDGAALRAVADDLAALPSRDPLRAMRVAGYLLQSWQLLGSTDPALLEKAMAQLLEAERRGLTGRQVPARGLEALQDREDYCRWRARVGARSPP